MIKELTLINLFNKCKLQIIKEIIHTDQLQKIPQKW